ncbi:cysteine hydrolase family protein [Streptococcus sp. H49]|uniref:cysteine hydrolase family protein n=1 Tax=Streptococcus huangxiaojuni TaxID=3237239 RepID=UPI0034A2DE97
MKTALLLIDMQKTFRDGSWGLRNNEDAEVNASYLLDYFRKNNGLIIHVKHRSEDPLSRFYYKNEGYEFQDLLLPKGDEIVISKEVNSAFIGTNLKEVLELNSISRIVIAGLTAPHCVSTTTRMAANLGYETILVEDATASFALIDHTGKEFSPQDIHDITLATLHDEFGTIVSTENILSRPLSL